MFVNAVLSVLMTLRLASSGNVRQAKEVLGNPQVSGALGDFLKVGSGIQPSCPSSGIYRVSEASLGRNS